MKKIIVIAVLSVFVFSCEKYEYDTFNNENEYPSFNKESIASEIKKDYPKGNVFFADDFQEDAFFEEKCGGCVLLEEDGLIRIDFF